MRAKVDRTKLQFFSILFGIIFFERLDTKKTGMEFCPESLAVILEF